VAVLAWCGRHLDERLRTSGSRPPRGGGFGHDGRDHYIFSGSSGSCVGERCPSEGGPSQIPDRPPGALGGPVGPALVDTDQISAAWGAPAWPKPSTAARPGPPSAGRDPCASRLQNLGLRPTRNPE